jgi:hypothetical protein
MIIDRTAKIVEEEEETGLKRFLIVQRARERER